MGFKGPARWGGTEGGKRSVQAHAPAAAPVAEPEPTPEGPDATDAAKALAAEYGINLANVTGTGQDGRIVIGDVDALVQKAQAPPAEPIPDEAEEVAEAEEAVDESAAETA